ncbi:hypothetical protein BpHYR1_005129 [Brachionus plicatilis]|uniref:Uncharacterized protein n=1 Tax=Brachionus plicatilis TaxID=10195 RepID=A0A3M7SNS9_BRAPC|nr:hypothetical protein BpHYR1_005129 [Brachionus plicatilis]
MSQRTGLGIGILHYAPSLLNPAVQIIALIPLTWPACAFAPGRSASTFVSSLSTSETHAPFLVCQSFGHKLVVALLQRVHIARRAAHIVKVQIGLLVQHQKVHGRPVLFKLQILLIVVQIFGHVVQTVGRVAFYAGHVTQTRVYFVHTGCHAAFAKQTLRQLFQAVKFEEEFIFELGLQFAKFVVHFLVLFEISGLGELVQLGDQVATSQTKVVQFIFKSLHAMLFIQFGFSCFDLLSQPQPLVIYHLLLPFHIFFLLRKVFAHLLAIFLQLDHVLVNWSEFAFHLFLFLLQSSHSAHIILVIGHFFLLQSGQLFPHQIAHFRIQTIVCFDALKRFY